jgi:hypothetical protein
MKAFFAIVKLTCRHALRSHVFQLLAFLLLACVAFVPTTVGAGNASEFIRVSLLYSLSGVTAILLLSSMWVSGYTMANDIDNYQLHMLVTKPVSRPTIWFAKFSAVVLVHLVLLLIATTAIYAIIIYRFESFQPEDFPASSRAAIQAEREKIRNEVMVGREVFLPDRPDYDLLTKNKIKEMVIRADERNLRLDLSPESQEKMFENYKKEIMAADARVNNNGRKTWIFSNLPKNIDSNVALRYRPYVGKVSSEDQRQTSVLWFVGIPMQLKDQGDQASAVGKQDKSSYNLGMLPLSQNVEQVMSGVFHEKILDKNWNFVAPDNKVYVSAINFDPSKADQYYQPLDGPKLLIPVC